MLLIFLDWIYTFFICCGMGLIGNHLLRIHSRNLLYVLLIGLFIELIGLHFYLINYPANEIFYTLNSIMAAFGLFYFKNQTKDLLKLFINNWKAQHRLIKILGILLGFMILAQSATIAFIPDNESYYIQTIKWLNQYGLVKGLANLHIYFGQMSGWHILQSAFNFGWISQRNNDLNGFLILIFNLFFLWKLDSFLKNRKPENLFLASTLIGNLFYFQFVNAPSPDLCIYMIYPLIFYLFYENFRGISDHFRLIVILCTFVTLVKIMNFSLFIFPMILLYKGEIKFKKFLFVANLGFVALLGFVCKNYLITGYPLYPIKSFGELYPPNWQIPEKLMDFYYNYTQASAFTRVDVNVALKMTVWEKFKVWIMEPKLRMLFNLSLIFLLVIFPFFARKNKILWLIYLYCWLNFLILFYTSPQYRFFIPIIAFFIQVIFVIIFHEKTRMINYTLLIFSILPIFGLMINLNIKSLVINKHMATTQYAFNLKNLIIPPKNSRLDGIKFKKLIIGNLTYFSPEDSNLLMWITSDGPLPCVNEKQLNYFKNYQKIMPQKRNKSLKDGFISIETK